MQKAGGDVVAFGLCSPRAVVLAGDVVTNVKRKRVTQTLLIEESSNVLVPKYHLVRNAFYLPQLPTQCAMANPFAGSCLHCPLLLS